MILLVMKVRGEGYNFASGHIDRVEISPRHLRSSGWLVQGPKESSQRTGREVNHAIFNSRSRRAR